jgi:hypothetical protein
MINKKLILAPFLMLFTLFLTFSFFGCNNDNLTNSDLTDDEFLQYVVASGYSSNSTEEDNLMSYESSDLNDNGPISDDGKTNLDSLYKWGRIVTNVNLNYNITNQGDSIKTVRVTRTISGNYIILGYINNVLDTTIKPYTAVLYRDIAFKRIGYNPRPRYNWRLYKISMLSGGTTQPQTGGDKVLITKIEVYQNNSATPNYIFNGPDFTQNVFTTVLFGGNGIPVINRNSQVKIKVYTTSQNSDIDYVSWHWARNSFGFHRIPFTLESQTGSGPYFRVYAKTFSIYGNHNLGAHNGYINASTRESLYDDDITKFASTEAGLVYKVLQ